MSRSGAGSAAKAAKEAREGRRAVRDRILRPFARSAAPRRPFRSNLAAIVRFTAAPVFAVRHAPR